MTTIYILIMVFGAATVQSGVTVVQAEFSTLERCERARERIAKTHPFPMVRSQGCYQK